MSYSSKKAAARDAFTLFGWFVRGGVFVVVMSFKIVAFIAKWGIKLAKSQRDRKKSKKTKPRS